MKIKSVIAYILGIIIFYFIGSAIWSLLNMQTCTLEKLPEKATCEQIAENDSKNCKYVILRWKKVDYNAELKKCQQWEENNK